ncbi:uncharacterized protein LOC131156553 [Malania oleifera]|uniref:uncharacterized protein LOC131156553 n=1 Tax=Malania oleifera TaxID=397392 RepID=UPI0025AE190C|nr:uncharacterized protein LOC131156553 [Malania oleifera]
MVRQMSDSKFSEYGLSSAETSLPSRDKQSPVAVRKAPLRNLQNDNRIVVPKATGNSLFSKERGSENRVGTKRPSPESPVNPACHQSQGSNMANGHLVYVRRKSEVDVGKSSSCDATRNHVDCQDLKQLGPQEETTQPKPEIKDTEISFPAVAPFPVASLANHSSGKPSIPLLSGRSGVRFPPADSSYIPVTNAIPSLDNPTRRINRQWEERSLQLKILLRKLDQSNREDYVQMLRSLSSVELSRHAVDLEKRAIQLALEEGKELERVRLLNVLGKSTRDLKAQSTQ